MVASAPHFCSATTTKIIPRSQSFNAARQIVGWDNPYWGINRRPQERDYTHFNIAFEYSRTFRDNRLAQFLFGNDLTCDSCNEASINISGSAIPAENRGANDWLADYFGLPRDYQSTVTFKPTISNYILDFSLYAGLNVWADGLYFKLYGPFVHTKWNLNAQECSADYEPSTGYFQGYFSSEVVPTSNLNQSFLAYANGAVPEINNNYSDYYENLCLLGDPSISAFPCELGPITWQSLCCSKISPECGCDGQGLTRNGFAELRAILGYNFINDEDGDYHLGLGIYVAAPTGTSVGDQDDCNGRGRYLFEPIVGNGKHWELGAQVTAHYIGWRNEEDTKSFGLYIEANITHLFAARQTRCFDLCSAGSNSRYMLAQRLDSNRNSFPGLNAITAANVGIPPAFASQIDTLGLEFANEYAPVANITRRNVTSTIGAQGDVAFSFAYQSGNFQWDLGYNFWGISCEKLRINDCCAADIGQWALKGDQRVGGFTASTNATIPGTSLFMKLPATDSQATIHQGSNMANGVNYTGTNPKNPVNFYADNSLSLNLSAAHPGATIIIEILPDASAGNEPTIYTSNPPILIEEDDFALCGTRGISNKFFTHFNYAWPFIDEDKFTPYVGLGVEVECGGRRNGCCNNNSNACSSDTCCAEPVIETNCNFVQACCENVALSQWGIWFKIGAVYN